MMSYNNDQISCRELGLIMATAEEIPPAEAAVTEDHQPEEEEDEDESVIADPSLVGSDLSPEKMNTMVVRGHGAKAMAEVCRKYHGYTTGAAMGAMLTVDVNSGRINGARYAAIGEAGVEVIAMPSINARKVWPECHKKLVLNFNLKPDDLVFTADAGPVHGGRCASEWVDFLDSDAVTLWNQDVQVDKGTWKEWEGVKDGACLKVMLEPESPAKAKVRVLVAPLGKEVLIQQCTDKMVNLNDPAMPVISMANGLKIRFYPREEPGSMTSGLGFLPLLYINCPEGAGDPVLPVSWEVKKELFNLLRDTGKPKTFGAKDWPGAFAETHWQKLKEPTLQWPAPPPAPGAQAVPGAGGAPIGE